MDWIVLLPPVVAIGLALWTREVYLSLFIGLWLGTTILVGGNPILGLRELGDQLVIVFSDAGNTRIVFFCLLVGSLIALVQASGGVMGFVNWAQRRGLGTTRRGAELLAWTVGMVIFVESSITSLTVGAVSRSFFDKLKLPREKLAYYCDATSAPVCMMLPLNGWGAYILGLLAAQGVMDTEAVGLLVSGLAFNFFAIFAIIFSFVLAFTGWSFGPMARAEKRAKERGELIRKGSIPMISEDVSEIQPVENSKKQTFDLLIPILTMVGMIFVGLYITGDGNLMKGSGSTSVLWAVATGIAVAMALYTIPRGGKVLISPVKATGLILKGASGLLPVTILIVFAFALGQVSRALEMGPYLVQLIGDGGPAWYIPSLIFVIGCLISFTLGSSWTTFAVLIPIALPLAEGLGMSPALLLGAVMSGGVFGDHASPLSDTSIISSMSSACDHVDHVNTQLPYTLGLAALTVVCFAIAGLIA
ncbi:MAG: Na+/H+ antiporter NhaC family protein [Rhodothermales bacterium]